MDINFIDNEKLSVKANLHSFQFKNFKIHFKCNRIMINYINQIVKLNLKKNKTYKASSLIKQAHHNLTP